jgi:F-type H+-transporting ATPase subunit delta
MAAIISRYARAFADVVLDKKLDPRRTEEELQALADLVRSAPELRTVWENPSVDAAQKRAVLDAIVARIGASRMVRNFVALLIDNRRIAALPEIARQVELELNERFGLAEADVTTARELADAEKRALEARVGEVTGKKVRARYATDRGLLGGAVVKVGSTVYDGSIRRQLEKLKHELSEA